MSSNGININELLAKWQEAKTQMAELEKKCDKYKKVADKIMKEKGTSLLEGSSHTLTRKQMTRGTMSKTDVPIEVWNKYSRSVSYPAYFLATK